MAGIVLVTKPSFLFPGINFGVLNSSWIVQNETKNWRNQYAIGNFFFFDLKSKQTLLIERFQPDFCLEITIIKFFILPLFCIIAPIPAEQDPEDYYFIGALLALTASIVGGAMIVLCSKVTNIKSWISNFLPSSKRYGRSNLFIWYFNFRLETMYLQYCNSYTLAFLLLLSLDLQNFWMKRTGFSPIKFLKSQFMNGGCILASLAQVC